MGCRQQVHFMLYCMKSMKLSNLLQQKKEHILKRWFSFILGIYPPDVSNFLKLEKDRFMNPVGYTITTGMETLFDEVTHGTNSERISSALDSIIRIFAVQDFSPSQVLAFVFLLKKSANRYICLIAREGEKGISQR